MVTHFRKSRAAIGFVTFCDSIGVPNLLDVTDLISSDFITAHPRAGCAPSGSRSFRLLGLAFASLCAATACWLVSRGESSTLSDAGRARGCAPARTATGRPAPPLPSSRPVRVRCTRPAGAGICRCPSSGQVHSRQAVATVSAPRRRAPAQGKGHREPHTRTPGKGHSPLA